MRNLLTMMIILLAVFTVNAVAQTAQPPPSDDLVCISRDAAEKASKAFDVVKAQTAEILELKLITTELKIKLAVEVQKTIDLKAEQKRNGVIIEYLLKNPRRSTKIGLFNF